MLRKTVIFYKLDYKTRKTITKMQKKSKKISKSFMMMLKTHYNTWKKLYIWNLKNGNFFNTNRHSQESKKGVKNERMKKQTCENFDPTEQSIKDCYIHTLTNIDIHCHMHAHHIPFKYYPWIIWPTAGLHQHRRRSTSFVYGYIHIYALYLSWLQKPSQKSENNWFEMKRPRVRQYYV